jgi:hypothetical protein
MVEDVKRESANERNVTFAALGYFVVGPLLMLAFALVLWLFS